ncbi:MAG TPA: hypothetical protein PKE29_15590 [Phycisphaerales bacterium]|nr:hypothetical protein [Phycisphaerales bacterium]
MSRFSITTRDDLGRAVPVFDVVAARNGEGRESDPDLPACAAKIVDALEERVGVFTSLNGGHYWLLGMGTLGWVVLGAMRATWPVLSGWWWGALLMPFFVLGGVMQSRWLRKYRGNRIVAMVLGAGRCGSCGFSLRGLRAVDGTVRCPECAASWAQSRIAGAGGVTTPMATSV